MIVSPITVVIGSVVTLVCIGWFIWAATGTRKHGDMMFSHRVAALVVGFCALAAVVIGIFGLPPVR